MPLWFSKRIAKESCKNLVEDIEDFVCRYLISCVISVYGWMPLLFLGELIIMIFNKNKKTTTLFYVESSPYLPFTLVRRHLYMSKLEFLDFAPSIEGSELEDPFVKAFFLYY